MGIGPINAIYQARFNRYLANRRIADTSRSRVWAFLGDGECDEPESLGALSLAARESLDNLTFVVNCNLQRLDGPVRGNGKIIQELEAVFRGAGWNVIKVIWGSKWDELLARDVDGVLVNKMNTTLDGEFQKYSVESGAYIRQHFFGPDPRLRALVEHLTDDELRTLPRGGHDYHKLYAAYRAAVEHEGAPTAILAKTIKGWTLGPEVEARNATHQIKKMSKKNLREFRDRLHIDDLLPDAALADADQPPYCRPAEGSPEFEYMMERRRALDGSIPKRVVRGPPAAHARRPRSSTRPRPAPATARCRPPWPSPACSATSSGTRPSASGWCRSSPTRPAPSAWTRLFPEVGIYAAHGQLYEPVDAHLLLSYKESKDGQILEEGITEAGSMASFTAAGTAYATHGTPMLPFFIFYSMFGFQRVGDLIWAFGDSRGRGFLCGATAGRTTLHGEGLQHADGHSLVLGSTVPNLAAYDPAFAYELGVIVEDGIRRMYGDRAGGRLLLPHPLQRELRHAARCPRVRRGRDPAGPVPVRRRPRGPGPPGDGALQRHRPGRGPGGPDAAGRRPRRGRRAVERHLVQGPAGGRPLGRAVEPAPPHRHAPHARTSPRCSRAPRGRWWPSPTS